MSSTLAAKQLAGAHSFLEHVSTANYTALEALLAPEFTHELLPATVSQGKRTKGEFIEHLQRYFSTLLERLAFLPPMDIIQSADAIVFHVKCDGMSHWGQPYNNEYMVTFRFDGEKIAGVKEFVDTQYAIAFMAGPPPQ